MIERTDIYDIAFTGNIGFGAYTSVVKAALSYPFRSWWLHGEWSVGLIFDLDSPPIMYTRTATPTSSFNVVWLSFDCVALSPDITDAQFEPITTLSIQAVFVTPDSAPKVLEVENGDVTLYLCREPYSPLTGYPWSFFVGEGDYLWMHIEGAPSTCDDYALLYNVPKIDMSKVDYLIWFWGAAGQSYCLPFSLVEHEGTATAADHSVVSIYAQDDLQAPLLVEEDKYSELKAGRRVRLRCSVPLSPDDYQTATAIADSPYYYYYPQCFTERDPMEVYDVTRCNVEDFSVSWEYGDGSKDIEITITKYGDS